MVVDLCWTCENLGDEIYDEEYQQIIIVAAAPKISKYNKKLTPQQLEEKRKRYSERIARESKLKEERIRKQMEERAKKMAKLAAHKVVIPDDEYKKLSPKQKAEQDILKNLVLDIPQNMHVKDCSARPDNGPEKRGPSAIPELIPHIPYYPPNDYFSIPLKVQGGAWLGNSGSKDEWINAYHGTTLECAASILKTGFRAGTGQACANNKNLNAYADQGSCGVGIYCAPMINTAFSYTSNKSYGCMFYCIIQCRVNPKALKISSPQAWLVNNPADIRPYKILVKKTGFN